MQGMQGGKKAMEKMKDIRSWMIKKDENNTIREVIFTMKKGEGLKSCTYSVLILILAFALAMLLIQAPAHGAVTCPSDKNSPDALALKNTDFDGDGFSDYAECYGITLMDQSHFYGRLEGRSMELPPDQYLDPDTKDLFVILVKATDLGANYTNITQANPLEYVSRTLAQGGLAITTHPIGREKATLDRLVTSTSTQKAVRVTESLDTSDPNQSGQSDGCGTPNGSDNARVYTENIKNRVNSVYQSAKATVPPGLIDTYIKHTIAHEIAHALGPLAPTYNAKFAGYHYKSGTNVEMDQSVYYTSKGSTVNFYIGTTYTSADQSAFKLK